MQLFKRHADKVEDLRNAVQHLNHEIENLMQMDLPVWGTLSWFAALDQEAKIGFTGCLVAGTLFETKDIPLVNPVGRELTLPVDLITLTAHGHEVNLSRAMKAVEQLTASLEEQLEKQFEGHPTAGGDMFIGVRLGPGEPGQNE